MVSRVGGVVCRKGDRRGIFHGLNIEEEKKRRREEEKKRRREEVKKRRRAKSEVKRRRGEEKEKRKGDIKIVIGGGINRETTK